MSNIKAIFWDFAGVILHTVNGSFNSLLAERLGVSESMVEKVINSPMNDRWDVGEISDEAFYTHLLNEIGQPLSKMPIIERFVVKDFYVDAEIITAIKQRRKAQRMTLLTNFPAHIHTFLKTDWNIEGAFDDLIASCDVKLIKPDPAIYTLALERAHCDPEQVVFIDDRPINVQAAQELGMHGIIFENRKQAIADLDKITSS